MQENEIFLSYTHEDRLKVERILQAIRARGWNVFIDLDIFSGADWRKVLENQLQTTYAVVVVWSSHSVESDWVAREAAVGLAKDRLFPVLIDRDITLPGSFECKHAVDLRIGMETRMIPSLIVCWICSIFFGKQKEVCAGTSKC